MTHNEQRDITAIRFSFVAPAYNEAESLPAFYAQLREAADRLGEPYEIVLVNDGSTDDSLKVMRRLREDDDRVKVIDLSRNFGQQEALTAGYDFATGAAVISLDADGQHPPELIAELAAKWRQGYEVVYTVRHNTQDLSLWKRLASRLFYRAFSWLSGMDVADQADFRLLDRKVVDALKGLRERARFVRGLVRWVGFRQVAVEYEARSRKAGKSGYSLAKMGRMAAAGIFNFSLAPVRLIGLVGATMLVAALLKGLVSCVGDVIGLFLGGGFNWWVSLPWLLIGLTGLLMVSLAVVGEYVGRTFEQVKGRPIYVLREVHGFDRAEEVKPAVQAPPVREEAPPVEASRIRLWT